MYIKVPPVDDLRPVRGPGAEPGALSLGLLSDNEKSTLKIVALLGAGVLAYFLWKHRKKKRR
jgi:hypothetical protein